MKTKTTIPKQRKSEVMLTCRMSKELLDQLNKVCRFTALTRSEYIRLLIEKSIKENR